MTPDEKLDFLIQRLGQLESIVLAQGTLGFAQDRQFIYIEKGKSYNWTFIATDEPVKASSITGYIVDIYRKEDDIPKLHVVIKTSDAEYVLCSGFETHFSRDVMAAIAQLQPWQLKTPLKVIPTIKRPKPGEEPSKKQPVYANVLFDDKTIRTYQLKQNFSAAKLYQKAIAVLKGGNSVKPGQSTASKPKAPQVVAQSRVKMPPPGLDTELPPIPPMSAVEPEINYQSGNDVAGVQVQSIDWKAFCRQHNIKPTALKALAQELGLPMGKLNPRESALLYHQAYSRFVGAA